MPLNFHVPLPGPFSYTKRIDGSGTSQTMKGCLGFLLLVFVGPIWLCFALFWWTMVAIWFVVRFVVMLTVSLFSRWRSQT